MKNLGIKKQYQGVAVFSSTLIILTITSCYLALSEVARLGGGL